MKKSRLSAAILILSLVFVLIAFLFIWYIEHIFEIFMPAILAVLIVYLIYPLVEIIERKGITRSRAVLIIYIAILLGMLLIGVFVLPKIAANISELIKSMPFLAAEFWKHQDCFIKGFINSGWPVEFKNTLQNEFGNKTRFVQKLLMDFLRGTMDFVTYVPLLIINIILGLMIAYYFFRDARNMRKRILAIMPQKIRNDLDYCGREIHKVLVHFLQGQLLTAAIIAILEIIGLVLLKVKYPFFLGLIGGIFNVIPFFGPFISAIPAVTSAFTDSPIKALWVVLLFGLIQQIDNLWISPKVIEGKLGLHPITTIIAVIAGGKFWGIIGMVIILPMLAIVKIIWKRGVSKCFTKSTE